MLVLLPQKSENESVDDQEQYRKRRWMLCILEALNNGMSKAAVCRTFEVKQSTLIDTLNRKV